MIGPAPDLASVLAGWRLVPLADLAIVAGLAGYGWLATRAGGSGPAEAQAPRRWPARRVAAAAGAAVVLLVAVSGPVGVYAERLFWVHMLQHLMLIMVAPVLLVWAQPVRLLRRAGGTSVGDGLERVLRTRPVRWATAPLTGLAVYTVWVVGTHLTAFQQVSATDGTVRAVELVSYLVAGWLFFYPLLGAELGPWSLPHFLRFLVLALGMGADTLTGVVLMLTGHPLAPAYAASRPGWGPDALADQEVAGGIMWFGGDLLMMLLMIVVGVAWSRAASDQQGLGSWLEGARRRALLGGDDPAGPGGGDAPGAPDVDQDERALAAYNAALAALHERDGGGRR